MNEPTSQPKTLCVFSFLNFVFFLLVIVWVLRRVNAISYSILVFSHGKSAVVYIAETTQLSKQALLLVNRASGPANSSKGSIRISTRLLPYKMNFGNCAEKYVELSIMHQICDSGNICKSCLPSSVFFFSIFLKHCCFSNQWLLWAFKEYDSLQVVPNCVSLIYSELCVTE